MQSDIQSLGQLIVLLIKHADLSQAKQSASQQISQLVQDCSFKFKTWDEVLTHDFLAKELKLKKDGDDDSASKNEKSAEEESKANASDQDAIITYEEHRYEGAADLMPVK